MMNASRPIQAVVLALAASAAFAQSASTVLKESQVSESRLIEALKPADPASQDAAAPGERTRSIQPRPVAATARPASQETRPSSASVLITFETNSSELTPTARQSLDVVARALSDQQLSGLTFSIEGHADVRGNPDDNLRLSQARAESVRQYLVGTRNVDPSRLKAIGRGDREPINTRDVSAPENRRVTFVTQR